MSKPDFNGYNRVRAWDKAEKHHVEVYARDWYDAEGYTTVLVNDLTGNGGAYWVRKADLDWRYFGEPRGASYEVRQQYARRAAWDRREFWYSSVRDLSDRNLRRAWDGFANFYADKHPEKLHYGRVYATEKARREAGRELNAPSAAVRASDRAQKARQRAAQTSREAEQEWAAQDLAAHQR